MDTNTNLNDVTAMSMDGVDLLSNEFASVSLVSIFDDNGAAKNDRVECLDTNQPMSTDGSLRSSDSELNARGPQRRDPKYAVRNSPPYAYGTNTNDTTHPVVTDINTGYQGNFLSVFMPHQQVFSAFPEPFDIADNLIDASENSGFNADMNQTSSSERFPGSYSSHMAVGAPAAAKSSQFSAIEMSPDPTETSPSSGNVSSQNQNRFDSASMTSDDAKWADIDNMIREDTKQGDSINSSQKKNDLQLNCNTDVLSPVSTPSTYYKISTANGLEKQYPPTEYRQNNNGAISYNAHPQPNILWAQAGDVTTQAFIQNNQLPMKIATATHRGYVSTHGHNQPTFSGLFKIPILDMDPQANQLSPRLAINDSQEMVPLAYQPTQYPSGASDQIAMANATFTQTVSSTQMVDTQLLYPNETTSQTNNAPFSYFTPHNSNGMANTTTPFPQQTFPNVISAQTSAPPPYPNAWLLCGTSVQMANAVQNHHQPLCNGTGDQITKSQVSYPFQPPANGIFGHMVNAQQYKQQPPSHGLSSQTSVPISHPQTHIGPSGQIVKGQGMINNISVNLDGASETPSQTYPPKTVSTIPLFGSQQTHLSNNLGQSFLPAGSVAHDNGLLVSGSSQLYWQETTAKESAACMTTGLVANQATPLAQPSQVIPQAILIIRSSNQLLQSGTSPMVNACRQVPPVAGTNYQAGQRQLLPKSVAQQSSVSVPAQSGRKPRGPNKKRQRSADERVANLQDITAKNEDGDTPLHLVACNKDPYQATAMLTRLEREDKLKSVMDCGNNKEQTPLYLAVYQNLHGIVKILVDKGADPNCLAVIRHSNGEVNESKSAIHVASVNKKDRDYKRTLIELLKSKKLKINGSNNFGQTALHCAIQAQNVDPEHVNSEPTLKLLLDAEADIHYKDKDGLTPLMYAVKLKQLKLVKFLIEYCGGKGGKAEAIVKDTDHHKRTAQDMASEIRDTIGTEIWNILYNACT